MTEIDEQLNLQAQQSRNALVDHVANFNISLSNDVWRLIARAIVDARIDGIAIGMSKMENRRQLESYTQGYMDAMTDLGNKPCQP
jgi:hypothetical protein